MKSLSDLVNEYYNTVNPVTRCVLREIIEKRVMRGEANECY